MVEWMNEWIHSLIRSFVHWCKVSPVELESVLRLHPDVVDAAVVSVRDDVDGDLPRALVVPRSPDIRLSDVISFVNGSYRTLFNILSMFCSTLCGSAAPTELFGLEYSIELFLEYSSTRRNQKLIISYGHRAHINNATRNPHRWRAQWPPSWKLGWLFISPLPGGGGIIRWPHNKPQSLFIHFLTYDVWWKLSKLIRACRNDSLPKLARFETEGSIS